MYVCGGIDRRESADSAEVFAWWDETLEYFPSLFKDNSRKPPREYRSGKVGRVSVPRNVLKICALQVPETPRKGNPRFFLLNFLFVSFIKFL